MSRPLRIAAIVLAVLALGAVAGVLGVRAWRDHVVVTQDARARAEVAALIEGGDLVGARARLLRPRRTDLPSGAAIPSAAAWERLDLRVALALRDTTRLAQLHLRSPALVAASEEASLLVVRTLIFATDAGARDRSKSLRDHWRARESQRGAWLALDVDGLLKAGDRAGAQALLEATSLPGKEDCARLMRLALLNLGDGAKAVAFLEAAYAADPSNADLRLLRAQVLERAGQNEYAAAEYAAASAAAPRNPVLLGEWSDFLARSRVYADAARVLRDNAAHGAQPEFIQVRRLLYGRTVEAEAPSASEDAHSLAVRLRADGFWPRDQAHFVGAKLDAELREEVWWLLLLESLSERDEAAALDLLRRRPQGGARFNPELADALRIVVRWRASGRPPVSGEFRERPGFDPAKAPLLAAVRAWSQAGAAQPADVKLVEALQRDSLWSELAAEAGWPEASRRLLVPAAATTPAATVASSSDR